MKRVIFTLILAVCAGALSLSAKTLVVYYSYTNNIETIVTELRSQIECDVVEIEPATKGLDYAANNYALGNALLSAINANPNAPSSYPEIDSVDINLDEYDTVIIGAPLWWSHMAAPLQTFLFNNGAKMAGRNIGMIVSSHSSGISGVVADAKRLIPNGNFLEPSLWIRSSETPNSHTLISKWLEDINYQGITSVINPITDHSGIVSVYSINGNLIADKKLSEIYDIPNGIYIVRSKDSASQKILIQH